jgi:hypothetical protein
MDTHAEANAAPYSKEEIIDRASEELAIVLGELKAARKALRRDWEAMAPRERSVRSRVVKELEEQEQALLQTIEMNQ